MATTAQEALLAELLGDVGKLHDQIKALPEAFKEQIAPHLGALVQASAKATTAIDSAGKAKLSALDNQAAQLRIDMQKDFVSKLMDSIDRGVGQLVDADMNKESTRLQALQVQQQLGVQALSIANGSTQSILSLFRG